MKTEGYSLWMMPSGEVYERLNALIFKLSKKYGTPAFEPHVTLIGQVNGPESEITKKTARIAALIKLYRIEFSRIEFLSEYFRCLYIRVKETEAVMAASSKARNVFGRQDDAAYVPHMSIMYAIVPDKIKKEIIAGLGNETFGSFNADRICLFLTTGEPKDWRPVKEFKLSH